MKYTYCINERGLIHSTYTISLFCQLKVMIHSSFHCRRIFCLLTWQYCSAYQHDHKCTKHSICIISWLWKSTIFMELSDTADFVLWLVKPNWPIRFFFGVKFQNTVSAASTKGGEKYNYNPWLVRLHSSDWVF